MTATILVVDDEKPIIDLLTYNLKREGYAVLSARDGEEALALARQHQPALVILDWMLPKQDGLEVCRTLRRDSQVPIIMLTARDAEIDRVVGLELGADDYVVKPFSVRELIARVKNILRRSSSSPQAEPISKIVAGGLEMDPARRAATWQGGPLALTTLEFDLLAAFASHPNQVLGREKLLETVWGYDYFGDARAVDAAVKRLRHKLAARSGDQDCIVSVRGIGYKFEV